MLPHKIFAALLLSATLLFGQTPGQGARTHPPDRGTLDNNVYRNRTFGFSCKLPYGWVTRTKEISGPALDTAETRNLVLLAAFEQPPEAPGNSLNPAIVIAAEPADAYPGLKHAEDYYGPLKEVATAKGFAATNEPYDFTIGEKHLVRVDFAKSDNPKSSSAKAGSTKSDPAKSDPAKSGEKISARQSTLIILDRGYIVLFTFISETEEEVDRLIETLSFVSSATKSK